MALETTATFIGHNECFGLSAEKLKNNVLRMIVDILLRQTGHSDSCCCKRLSVPIKRIQITFLLCNAPFIGLVM